MEYLWIGLLTGQIQYLLIGGLPFFFFWKVVPNWSQKRLVQPRLPTRQDIKREVGLSIATIVVTTVLILPFLNHRNTSLTSVYLPPDQYGWLWFGLSFPFLFLVHDTYFYWMHRLLHLPWVFKHIHHYHHQSINPTPLAAFSMHPLQGALEIGWAVVVLAFVPINLYVYLTFALISTMFNVHGHLGIEIYPLRWHKYLIMKLANRPTFHSHHHLYGDENFGYYSTLWDRIMRTFKDHAPQA